MPAWVALLRGVNVGGHRRIAMEDLRAVAAAAGFARPRTYLQSGNLVFGADIDAEAAIDDKLSSAIAARFGFEVTVTARKQQRWEALVARNPFPEATGTPRSLHVFVTRERPPASAATRLAQLPRDDERFVLIGRTLYLHAPCGIGRSRFAASVERALGIPATARNWATISALAVLASDLARTL